MARVVGARPRVCRMRAVVITERGGPEVLQVQEVPGPGPEPGHVVIEVAAAGLNRADLVQTRGGHPPPPGAPEWPGLEASGVITAVGPGVQGWHVGQRVCALLDGGGYAEQVSVPVRGLLPVPGGVDLVEAAGLPEGVCTVWSNVTGPAGMDASDLDGAWVVVHGGSGGIGTVAIQLLAAMGARVISTSGGPERTARCAELGAEVAVDYRSQDFVEEVRRHTGGEGVSLILDVVGGTYLKQNLQALARHGHLVVIGIMQGGRAEIDLYDLMSGWKNVHGTLLRARPPHEKEAIVQRVREEVWPLVEQHRIRPVIHATLPLDEARQAQEMMASGESFGKILLVP